MVNRNSFTQVTTILDHLAKTWSLVQCQKKYQKSCYSKDLHLKGLGHERIKGRYFLILLTNGESIHLIKGRFFVFLVQSKQYKAAERVVMQESMQFKLLKS